ncbi:LacI family transcriptional regulator [Stackebrandtia endophytica]|uniref:LacI family transcriptional regulator n=1 Tax=Stackebrandtia endophytica TaxID=1496996 RepID=A0A543AQ70_9ACTN|nr:LacI family DNA-binding transcriptional regulator [Stackebrandtia endophytica]TQL74743.1 LacI family transcriptional regulator [Stackebrandtia endophytica]
MSQPVTLHDVAAAAEVSVATASRALSGKNRVSRETVAKVQAVAAELGYRVDPIARALREGSTRIIGMIVPVIGNPYFAQLVDVAEEQLQRRGFELLLADSHGRIDEELRRLTVFGERKVDGIIIVPSDRSASAGALRSIRSNIALVQIDRSAGVSLADFVGVDNDVAMLLLLEHLWERGARSVAFVGADDVTSSGLERVDAFHRALERTGLTLVGQIRGQFDTNTGIAAADEIADGQLPDAIVAGSDLIAFGLISRLRKRGIRVPDDVLVTGFDGTTLSQIFTPSLTTVVQPIEGIAADAVSFLIGRIEGSDAPVRNSRLTPTLRVGESTEAR